VCPLKKVLTTFEPLFQPQNVFQKKKSLHSVGHYNTLTGRDSSGLLVYVTLSEARGVGSKGGGGRESRAPTEFSYMILIK